MYAHTYNVGYGTDSCMYMYVPGQWTIHADIIIILSIMLQIEICLREQAVGRLPLVWGLAL